ncbi:MAG TPA: serine hydrolase domain-containing protein [Symbiobacteriaceae bacterium]|nr:serine hydrolase domain-containing protein [Symbiobacteriaceae bacterium]
MEQFLQGELSRHQLPAAYAVVVNGEVLLEGACAGNDADTPFEIGSITKSFTATAILQLRDKGLLDLDAPVRKYLPWFTLKDEAAAGKITLRHLLTNSSGIPTNAMWPPLQGDYARVWRSIEEGVRGLARVKPAFEPGAKFMYSNMGFAVLGAVVQAVSGRSWASYVQEEIMVPLGMTRSLADLHEGRLPLAVPHSWVFGRPWPVRHRLLGPFMAPAGSTTICSVRDLARYIAAHMGAIPLPGVSPASLEEAHRGVHSMSEKHRYAMGWVDGVAKGGERVVWHNGGTEGSRSSAMFAPDHGVGFVLLTSRTNGLVDVLAGSVMAILLGREASPVKAPPDYFRTMSWILNGITLLAVGLLIWLAWSLTTGAPVGWGKTVLFALLSAASGYSVLVWLPRQGIPPISHIRLWRVDVLLAFGGLLLASTLWLLYSLIQ